MNNMHEVVDMYETLITKITNVADLTSKNLDALSEQIKIVVEVIEILDKRIKKLEQSQFGYDIINSV